MKPYRIALANLRYPSTAEESLRLTLDAIGEAARGGARVVAFPECFVPGYRIFNNAPPPDAAFLERAWNDAADAAARHRISVVLGSERFVDDAWRLTAVVISDEGAIAFQDKVQLDPSEDATYVPGTERAVFRAGELPFGVVICHEGWRYPETVRWAARRGAKVVFHPHFGEAEEGSFRPTTYGESANSFHEKAVLCRAAENSCYFATINCASAGSPTTSAIANPDGTLLAWQPYGVEGLLVADIDLDAATGLLASRCRTSPLS